jgi:hypothetical protein
MNENSQEFGRRLNTSAPAIRYAFSNIVDYVKMLSETGTQIRLKELKERLQR